MSVAMIQTTDEFPSKVCIDCRVDLPLTQFYTRKHGSGYQGRCIECTRVDGKVRRDKAAKLAKENQTVPTIPVKEPGMTLEEIGAELGMTREGVRMAIERALAKLRRNARIMGIDLRGLFEGNKQND